MAIPTFEEFKERMTQAISDRVLSQVMAADNPLEVDIQAIIRDETKKMADEVRSVLGGVL